MRTVFQVCFGRSGGCWEMFSFQAQAKVERRRGRKHWRVFHAADEGVAAYENRRARAFQEIDAFRPTWWQRAVRTATAYDGVMYPGEVTRDHACRPWIDGICVPPWKSTVCLRRELSPQKFLQ